MFFTSSTNRWASRIVIVLQLTTWSAVSIVLLQKGVSSLQRRMLETTSHVIESVQSGNHFTEINQRVDNLEDTRDTSRGLRITRDKEHIFDNRSSKITEHAEQDAIRRADLVPEPVSQEEGSSNATGREADLASREPRVQKLVVRDGKTGNEVASFWKNKSRMSVSRMSDGGTTTAIAMVVIGSIMLLLGPTVIVLRILDERKQARKLVALSAIAREDLPPAYEQVVFMSEAPRYSTLSLNDDYSLPPTSAATSLIMPNST